MDATYWNQVAENYTDEIFSVLEHDEENLIAARVEKFASDTGAASDLGCGIGKFLSLLSCNFRHVYAYDISEKCLEQARHNCTEFQNIDYLKVDLAKQTIKIPKVDLALCVNSIIMPSISQRLRYFSTIISHLIPGGHLILVVPSFESAIYSKIRLIEWNQRNGIGNGAAVMAVWNENNKQKASHLQQGIVNIDHVPTKHYLKEELFVLLKDLGLDIHEVLKIEYDWRTEFSDPPHWLKEPFPWDWLVTARKRVDR
ncbi:MAG: class I SAM-dependent methyltransferase [Nitrospiraceae bacterium]|nr:MAG: class I SAM-dependent methyltransferase [Nitrospiraceae bacterium]